MGPSHVQMRALKIESLAFQAWGLSYPDPKARTLLTFLKINDIGAFQFHYIQQWDIPFSPKLRMTQCKKN